MAAGQESLAAVATEPPVSPSTGRAASKLLAWAILWCALAYLGLYLFSIGFGLVLYFTEDGYVEEALEDTNIAGTHLILSISVLMLLLACFAIRNARKAAGGDLRIGLGIHPIRRPRMVAGITAALLLYGFGLTLCALAFPELNPYPDLTQYIREVNPLLLLPAALLVGIVGPVAEELFFRGWLWTALRQYWGVLATATATGVFWYMIHASHGLLYMALLLPAVVAISAVRHVGGSLRASMLTHVTYNIFCVVAWLAMAFVVKV